MSSELRQALVAEARRWVETPFRHQAAVLGQGVDCWNLVREVGEACGVLEVTAEAFAPFAGYPRRPTPEFVRRCLETFLAPTATPLPGDVALLGAHMALLAEHQGRPTLIHAKGGAGGRVRRTGRPAERCVEHGFRPPWPQLVQAWYRYPGV